MNYLAHSYLSFGHPQILVGNIISDFVKGKKKLLYPPGVQAGIKLHRLIDAFTDEHRITQEAKLFFRDFYRLYSGAFVDIVYDHFLATDQSIFKGDALEKFTANTFDKLDAQKQIFPENFSYVYPYMKEHNWLLNYKHRWGIEKSFAGLVHRATFMNSSKEAIAIFEKNYSKLHHLYNEFFPNLEEYTKNEYQKILNSVHDP